MAAVVMTGGLLLAGCGGSGVGLAQEACTHVNRSISLYLTSFRQQDPAAASRLRVQAYAQLVDAEPLAAAANSQNGQWNPLMTTLSESARVSEAELIQALQTQCAVAATGGQSGPGAGPGSGQVVPGTTRPASSVPPTFSTVPKGPAAPKG